MKRQYYIQIFVWPHTEFKNHYKFVENEPIIVLGEIEQNPSHYVVMSLNGKNLTTLSSDYFREPKENEI